MNLEKFGSASLQKKKRGIGGIWFIGVTNILDSVHCPRLKSHGISKAGCDSGFRWKGKRRGPTQVGALERDTLNPWTEGWKLDCFEFLI